MTNINICRELLNMYGPRAFLYAKIGLSYLKMKDKTNAIQYLWLSTEISKQTQEGFDFTELIQKITGKYLVDESKNETKKIRMSEGDFNIEHYAIDNFDEIKSLVLNQNLSISDVCAQFGLGIEETNTVKLMFAKQYYAQGDYITGDRIVKHVEQSSNKTQFVRQLIDEIRRAKKFYKNRITDDTIFVKKITI